MSGKPSKKKAPPKPKKKVPKQVKRQKPAQRGKSEVKLSLVKLNPLPVTKDIKIEYKPHRDREPSVQLEPFAIAKVLKELGGLKTVHRDTLPKLPPSVEQRAVTWRRMTELGEDVQQQQPPPQQQQQQNNQQNNNLDQKNYHVVINPENSKRGTHGVNPGPCEWSHVVAAICNFLLNSNKRLPNMLWENVYPQDKSSVPKVSERGKYCVRVYHQNEWRILSIDDRVPVDEQGMCLYPTSFHPNELWPLIIAKAINKLFPGTEFTDNGAGIFYSFCGVLPFEVATTNKLSFSSSSNNNQKQQQREEEEGVGKQQQEERKGGDADGEKGDEKEEEDQGERSHADWFEVLKRSSQDPQSTQPEIAGLLVAAHPADSPIEWPETKLEPTLPQHQIFPAQVPQHLRYRVREKPTKKESKKRKSAVTSLRRDNSNQAPRAERRHSESHTVKGRISRENSTSQLLSSSVSELNLTSDINEANNNNNNNNNNFDAIDFSMFLVLPFVPLPLLADEDMHLDTEDDEDGSNKNGKKGKKKSNKSKPKPKPKKGKRTKEEELKMEEEERKLKEQEIRNKAQMELKFKAEQVRRQEQLEEFIKLGDHVEVVDLLAGNVTVVPCEYIERTFGKVLMVLDPSRFGNKASCVDFWKDVKMPYTISSPAVLTVSQSSSSDSSSSSASATSNHSSARGNPPSHGRQSSMNENLSSTEVSRSSTAGNHNNDNDQSCTERCVYLSVESYDAKHGEQGPLKGDSLTQHDGGVSARTGNDKEKKQKKGNKERAPLPEAHYVTSYDKVHMLHPKLESRELQFTLKVEAFDWRTNTSETVIRYDSSERQHTFKLCLPSSSSSFFSPSSSSQQEDNGCLLYRVSIESLCGYHLSAFSASNEVALENVVDNADGNAWQTCQKVGQRVFDGSYAAQPPDQWFVLFKYVMEVSKSGSEDSLLLDNGEEGGSLTQQELDQLETSSDGGNRASSANGESKRGDSASSTSTATHNLAPRSARHLLLHHQHQTLVSAHLTLMDHSLVPFVQLLWINNDTFEITRCGLLSTAATPFEPNENGYTLIATCKSPYACLSAKWQLALRSNKPATLDSFAVDNISKVDEYCDEYKHNSEYTLFRIVVSSFQNYLTQMAIHISTNGSDTGLLCKVYDLEEIQYAEPDQPAQPIFQTHGMGNFTIPVLQVTKDHRYVVHCSLDPLCLGSMFYAMQESFNDEQSSTSSHNTHARGHTASSSSGRGNTASSHANQGNEDGEEDKKKKLEWRMRCVSSSPLGVFADKTKQDEFNAIKVMWEKSKQGRSKDAKKSRQQFLEEKKDLLEFRKQPVINHLLPGERSRLVNEQLLRSEQQRLNFRQQLSAAHLKAMQRSREKQSLEATRIQERREEEFKKWREGCETQLKQFAAKREQYRNTSMVHEELVVRVTELLMVPFGSVVDNDDGKGKNSKSSNKTASNKHSNNDPSSPSKEAKDTPSSSDGKSTSQQPPKVDHRRLALPSDTNTGLNAYSTQLEQSISELSQLPQWKAEKISKMAILRLQQVAVQGLDVPLKYLPMVESIESEKHRDQERENQQLQLKTAIAVIAVDKLQSNDHRYIDIYENIHVINKLDEARYYLFSTVLLKKLHGLVDALGKLEQQQQQQQEGDHNGDADMDDAYDAPPPSARSTKKEKENAREDKTEQQDRLVESILRTVVDIKSVYEEAIYYRPSSRNTRLIQPTESTLLDRVEAILQQRKDEIKAFLEEQHEEQTDKHIKDKNKSGKKGNTGKKNNTRRR